MSHPVERSQRQVARQPVPARCSGQFLHHDPVALDFVQAKLQHGYPRQPSEGQMC
jgi:hypothetical protein